MSKILTGVFILMVGLIGNRSYAQDIGALKKQEPFTIQGGIGAGTTFFSSNEKRRTRDPFTWNLHGHLTPSFYGFSIPLAFSVSQYSKSYANPFSQFGMSPTYKWIKLHAGYRSINFSPLTFAGQNFLGAGIELNPRSFYAAAFYGRLNKAIDEDTTLDRHIQPQYSRTGYGIKLGIKNEKREATIMYVYAQDNIGSIKRYDTTSSVRPQANSTVGFSWKFRFFNKLNFSGDAAASLLSRDAVYEDLDSIGGAKLPAMLTKFAPVDYSSVLSWSGQAQLGLNLNAFNAMVGYRRVEPDFKSLGVPYMLNDVEMIHGSAGTRIAKGKVNLNGSFSHQHNNLRNMRATEAVSTNGNASANFFLSQNFNLNLNATGVKVFQKDGLLEIDDEQRMDQLMLAFVMAPGYNFISGNRQHSVNGSLAYTNLIDKNPLTKGQANGDNINASLNYGLFFLQKYFGLNTSVIYSTYKTSANQYNSLGVNVGGRTQVLKNRNLSLSGSAGYYLNKSSVGNTSDNISFSFNGNFSPTKHHSFGLFVSYLLTPPVRLNPQDELELNKVPYAVNSKILSGGLNYSYNF